MWKDAGLNMPLAELPEYKNQRRSKVGKTRSLYAHQIVGADTETIDGCVELFSWESVKRFKNDSGEIDYEFASHVAKCDTLYDVLTCCISAGHKWTAASRKGWSVPQFFFWNLRYDAQALLKLMSIRVIEKILEDGKATINAKTGDFLPSNGLMVEVWYLEGKSFTFTPKDWKVEGAPLGKIHWWDISQYFGKMKLDTAAKKHLGIGKQETCFDGSQLEAWRFNDPFYWEKYQDDIRTYAELDASLTGQLARIKAKELTDNGVRFIQPYSVANTAQRNLLDSGYFPTMNVFMEEEAGRVITSAFMSAFHGGLFEVSACGFIPNVLAYDLTSAYPFVMRHLPAYQVYTKKANREDLKGQWYWGKGDSWNEAIEGQPYGTLGVVEIAVTFKRGLKWYPLCTKAPSGTLVTPRRFSGWVTLGEYEEAMKWPIEKVQVGRWVIHCDKEREYPFRDWIDLNYEKKFNAPNPSVERDVAKLAINSAFGKTIQCIDGKIGKIWNPIYAATITGLTRARMMEFNRLNGMNAVSLATDGIIIEDKDFAVIPERPADAPHDLGIWEDDGYGDAYILMSGVYTLWKPDGKLKSTFRGTASYPFILHCRKLEAEGRGEEASWPTFLEEWATESKFTSTSVRPNSLKVARTMKRDFCAINIFEEHTFTLRAAAVSTKRRWTKRPQTFGDLLTNRYELLPHNSAHMAVCPRRIADVGKERMKMSRYEKEESQ